MWLRHVSACIGAVVLFAVGVATALADTPTTPTDTTTATTVVTDTTTTTIDATATATVTETSPMTTTAPEPTTTTTTTATEPQTTSPPPLREAPSTPAANPRAKLPEQQRNTLRHKKRKRVSKPLKVTPPLGQGGYVFPVVGDAGYIDTYGDFRSDVHGKWHHGDDIFAPLGTPVVAVASGTINRVGWRKAGGWRLWVRDSLANQFYYAHLSGYARTVFHSRYVKAGDVIGFVGNTGDAYPRAAHLHFEIHPRQLLSRQYDGAVDPTTYLDSWEHIQSVDAPEPMLPRLPKRSDFRLQARHDLRLLLAARDLTRSVAAIRPSFDLAPETLSAGSFARPLAAAEAASTTGTPVRWELALAVCLGLVAIALSGTAILRGSLRRGS